MRHPPHFLDKPGDAPKCKGYTFVTFSTKSHLEAVLRAWPWQRVRTNDEHGNAFPIMKEAYKYGLRAITKARWDALNGGYLVYKQSFVDEVARAKPETHRLDQGAPDHGRSEPTARPHPTPKLTHSTTSSSCATSAQTRLRSNCSLPKRSKTKMEVGKDTNMPARARPPSRLRRT